MGEEADRQLTAAASDPELIRAEMAKTRSALEQKLGELKNRLLHDSPAPRRIRTVAKKKKAAPKKSAPKKAAKKSAPKKSAKTKGAVAKGAAVKKKSSGGGKKKSSGAKKGMSVKRAAGKAARKTAEVLGDVLAGAARGALKGAAEVVEETAHSAQKPGAMQNAGGGGQ
jgi:hypothetical protein